MTGTRLRMSPAWPSSAGDGPVRQRPRRTRAARTHAAATQGLYAVAARLLGPLGMPPLEGRWWVEDERPALAVPRARSGAGTCSCRYRTGRGPAWRPVCRSAAYRRRPRGSR